MDENFKISTLKDEEQAQFDSACKAQYSLSCFENWYSRKRWFSQTFEMLSQNAKKIVWRGAFWCSKKITCKNSSGIAKGDKTILVQSFCLAMLKNYVRGPFDVCQFFSTMVGISVWSFFRTTLLLEVHEDTLQFRTIHSGKIRRLFLLIRRLFFLKSALA